MSDTQKEKKPCISRLWLPLTIVTGLLNIFIPSVIGMYVCTVPLWARLVTAAAFVGAVVMLAVTAPRPRRTAVIAGIVAVLVLAASTLGCMLNPYFNSVSFRYSAPSADGAESVTLQQAQEDMEQLMFTLKRIHPAFIDETPAEVASAYDKAMAQLQADDDLTVDDVQRALQTTVSVLGDAHTNVYSSYTEPHYRDNGIELKSLGYSLTAVDGQPLVDILRDKSELFSYEAESWGMEMLRQNLSTSEGLRYLGYDLDSGVAFTYEREDGAVRECTYTAENFIPYDECVRLGEQYISDDVQPAAENCYEIDTDRDAAILVIASCTYDDAYRTLLHDLFTEIKQSGVSNLIIDLRGNGGGNSMVANELIRYLDVDSYQVDTYHHRLGFLMMEHDDGVIKNDRIEELTFDGDVYLLTDSASFSSAMLFALYFKDNGLGTLIGEAPGNAPNSYGDITIFRMEETGLYLSVSTKQFFRPDTECTDLLVEPDVPCAGKDAMDKAFELIAG